MFPKGLTIIWQSSTTPRVYMECHVTRSGDNLVALNATSSAILGKKDRCILADLVQTLHTTLQDMSQRNSQLRTIPVSWVDILSSDACPLNPESEPISSPKSLLRSSVTTLNGHSKMCLPLSNMEPDNYLSGDTYAANYANKSDAHLMPRKAHSTKSKRTCSLCAKLRSIIRALSKRR